MGPFFVVIDPPEADAQRGLGARTEDVLCLSGWRRTLQAERARVFELGAGSGCARQNRGDIIVGEMFHRAAISTRPEAGSPANEPDLSSRAMAYRNGQWGRFLSILFGTDGQVALYRDPSGALDPFVWPVGPSLFIASGLPDVLPPDMKPKLKIDWDQVGGFLARPDTIHDRSGLAGIVGVAPGGLLLWDGHAASTTQLWRPSEYIGPTRRSFEAHAVALREVTDDVLKSFADQAIPALAECSGGFDSAVTATGLCANGQPLKALLNYAVEDSSGDERSFAEAVAAHAGLPLDISFKVAPDLSPSVISETATGFRPSLAGLDEAYEAALLRTVAAKGVSRVFTGHGGDSVFFQLTTPLVLRDRVLRSGVQSLSLEEVGRLARWSRRSAYSLLMLALGLRTPSAMPQTPAWIRPSALADHPWLEGLTEVGPAKRFQIQSLLQSLDRTGRSRLDGCVDVVHPLMAQPVLEAAIAIPADVFVVGGRGRALARASFRDRLPPLILARRSKGELGGFYARAFVHALPQIIPFLADGLLAERGLLDSDRLRSALDESTLAHGGGFAAVLRAVAIESWVRYWSSHIATAG